MIYHSIDENLSIIALKFNGITTPQLEPYIQIDKHTFTVLIVTLSLNHIKST